jgi:hypothetical protein
LTCDTRFFDFRFFETEIEVRSRLSETELDRRHWRKPIKNMLNFQFEQRVRGPLAKYEFFKI